MLAQRDHPFNRSTKPLLPPSTTEYITKQQPFSIIHSNKIKRKSQQQIHQQQQLLNAKVCGFDDFDYVTQQYSKFNGTIGYPYGCPPSPTAVITNAEFTFSDDLHATITAGTTASQPTSPPPLLPPPPPPMATSTVGRVAATATGVYPNGNNNHSQTITIDNSYGTLCGSNGHSNWNRNDFDRCGSYDDYDDVENRLGSTTGPFIFGVHNKNEHSFHLPVAAEHAAKVKKEKKAAKKGKAKSSSGKGNANKVSWILI